MTPRRTGTDGFFVSVLKKAVTEPVTARAPEGRARIGAAAGARMPGHGPRVP